MPRFARILALVTTCAGCAPPPPTEPCIGAEVSVALRYADPTGVEQLDLLFVVDHGSVPDETADELVEETTRMLSTLASGSFRGSSFWPIRDVHVGVVSSDLGAGAAPIGGCTSQGDDGLLLACPGDHAHALVRGSDARPLRCALSLERACGVSQPLESMLKAISTARPAWGRDPSTFADADGTPDAMTGHGDGANAGFLRFGHLAIVIVTARDDCSLGDIRALRDDPAVEGEDVGSWCESRPELLREVSRYADALPHLSGYTWVSVLAGVGREANGDALASASSCASDWAGASAPARLMALAEEADVPVDVTPMCLDDLRPAFDRLLTRIASVQCPVGCLERPMRVDDDGTIDCQLYELLPEHGEVTSCAMLPGRALVERVESETGGPRELCRLTQLSATAGEHGVEPGWWYDERSPALRDLCAGWVARIAVSETAPTPEGAELRMRCESTTPIRATERPCSWEDQRTCGVGARCDSTVADACVNDWVELTCDVVDHVCAPACATDEDCVGPGLEGQRCDLRTLGRVADERGVVIDPERRDLVRGVCVRPVCR
jgi:hypothetical protein